MQVSKEVEKLKRKGILTELYQRGLISHTPTFYLDIYNKHLKGYSYRQLAKLFNTSIGTVATAIKSYS